jgi:two-component sensor histidine kinase
MAVDNFSQVPRGRASLFRDQGHRDLVEMNHRVANSLQLTASYLVLQARETTDSPGAKSALEAAAARVSAMAELHRQISSDVDAASIDLSSYLTGLCPKISGSTGVNICFSGQPVEVPVPAARRIAQIVTELAINTGKHDRSGRGEGRLRVDCQCDNQHVLHLVLKDEGHASAPVRLPGPSGGMGLAIVASAVNDLDGRIDVSCDKGIVFELTVPLH